MYALSFASDEYIVLSLIDGAQGQPGLARWCPRHRTRGNLSACKFAEKF